MPEVVSAALAEEAPPPNTPYARVKEQWQWDDPKD